MPYLYATAICGWLYLVLMVQTVNMRRKGELSSGRYMVQTLLLMAGMLLMSAPLTRVMLEAMQVADGRPIALGGGMRATLWVGCLGAGLGVGVFGARLWLQRREPVLTFRAMGVNALGTILSAYIVFVTVDQLQFSADRERTGFLNIGVLQQELRGAKDIDCPYGILLVRDAEADLVEYRCPTSILLGMYSDVPFAPWPSYTEGTSTTLGADIKALHRSAIKVE